MELVQHLLINDDLILPKVASLSGEWYNRFQLQAAV